jgi:hypothetical protein
MPDPSVEELLRSLTGVSGDSAAEVYGQWALLTPGDSTLEQLVKRKLVANAKSAQIRESLEETLRAGGATGDSIAEMLQKTGLVGFS